MKKNISLKVFVIVTMLFLSGCTQTSVIGTSARTPNSAPVALRGILTQTDLNSFTAKTDEGTDTRVPHALIRLPFELKPPYWLSLSIEYPLIDPEDEVVIISPGADLPMEKKWQYSVNKNLIEIDALYSILGKTDHPEEVFDPGTGRFIMSIYRDSETAKNKYIWFFLNDWLMTSLKNPGNLNGTFEILFKNKRGFSREARVTDIKILTGETAEKSFEAFLSATSETNIKRWSDRKYKELASLAKATDAYVAELRKAEKEREQVLPATENSYSSQAFELALGMVFGWAKQSFKETVRSLEEMGTSGPVHMVDDLVNICFQGGSVKAKVLAVENDQVTYETLTDTTIGIPEVSFHDYMAYGNKSPKGTIGKASVTSVTPFNSSRYICR